MTGRLTWLDLARGFAVISMIVAHTSPWGGVLNVSEYLTAPWFAMLIGISLLLAWEKAGGWVVFVFGNVARGLLLILIGEWLQRQYGQIDVVLQTLGLLIIVLAPIVALVGSRPAVWAGLGLVVALVSPLAMDATREWLAGAQATEWLGRLLELSLAGGHYRVSSFIAICGVGMAAVPLLLRRSAVAGVRGALTSAGLLVGAAVSYAIGRLGPWGADAYSGTTFELIGAALLSLSATWACAWLVAALGQQRVRAGLGAVVDTGRMALTAYIVQVLALALIVGWGLFGGSDDHWAIMLGVIALCLGFSWAWLKVFDIGPLEWVLRLPHSSDDRDDRAIETRRLTNLRSPGMTPIGHLVQTPPFWHAVLMDTPAAPDPDPNSLDLLWGAGLIGIVIGLAIYLAILALMLWIGYLIIKASVRNGLREHTLWLESRRGPLR